MFLMLMVYFAIFSRGFQAMKLLPNERIIGGRRVTVDIYPFMAAIVVNEEVKCGCAIISPVWVLTAAHCLVHFNFRNKKKMHISAGKTAWLTGNIHDIVSWAAHEKYDNDTIDNDIGLIRVKQPFDAQHEKAIPLATESYEYKGGTKVMVMGWGVTKYEAAPATEKGVQLLNGVDVFLLNQTYCSELYYDQTITDSMVCAGTAKGGQDACTFDSGGPLFDSDLLIGIVSWGLECAAPDQPGVYTRVNLYINWITETTKKLKAPIIMNNISNAMHRSELSQLSKSTLIKNSSGITKGWVQYLIILVLLLRLTQ